MRPQKAVKELRNEKKNCDSKLRARRVKEKEHFAARAIAKYKNYGHIIVEKSRHNIKQTFSMNLFIGIDWIEKELCAPLLSLSIPYLVSLIAVDVVEKLESCNLLRLRPSAC